MLLSDILIAVVWILVVIGAIRVYQEWRYEIISYKGLVLMISAFSVWLSWVAFYYIIGV